MKKNIILTGMPGAGKSTVGVLLAKALGMDFVDTDILIQNEENTTLQDIIDSRGLDEFLNVENRVLSNIRMENTVIATGGSAVYGKEAMANLAKNATIVYLKLSPKILETRLSNIKTRGVVIKEGQTIADLFNERDPLYVKYADIILDTDNIEIEETVEKIKSNF